MKAFLQNVGLMIVASLIALAGIEIGMRIWGNDVLVLGNQNVFFKFDPVLGWANLPNMHGQFSRIEFSYPVEINSIGMWDAEIADKRKDEFRVAFLGDSFTWGVGVAYGERFTEVVEAQNPIINALNFGASGYSPVQYLLQIDQVLALKPDYVIIAFCLGNDLTDNVESDPYGHPKPVATLSPDGSQVEIGGYPLSETNEVGPVLFGAGSAFRIVGFIDQQLDRMRRKQARDETTGIPSQYPVVEFIKQRIARLLRPRADKQASREQIRPDQFLYASSEKLTAEQRQRVAFMYKVNELLLDAIRVKVEGAIGPNRFAVLLAPTKYEYGLEHLVPPGGDPAAVTERMRASLSRLGIPSIDGRPALTPTDFWKVDAHWRPGGHKKIGQLLGKFLAVAIAEAPSGR
jgi:lysophospholipase L1-like esterase